MTPADGPLHNTLTPQLRKKFRTASARTTSFSSMIRAVLTLRIAITLRITSRARPRSKVHAALSAPPWASVKISSF